VSEKAVVNEVVRGLVERLDALERENQAWRGETARLARELEVLKASGTGAPEGGVGVQADRDQGAGVSRRGVLRLGAAAAAAATAGGFVGAPAALAGTDGDLTLGSVSNSAGGPTGLAVSGNTSKYGIGVTDNGLGAYPNSVPPAALFGHAHNANFQSGVVGYSDTGMEGVVGRSDPIDNTSRPGVFGVGQPGVSGFGGGTSPGVVGTGNGTGVEGIGAPGVQGTADAYLDTGVHGTNPGTILGSSLFPAEGIGVLAECTDGGAGPPTPASVALSARNDGSGIGVKATSVSGIPIMGQISRASSASPVVDATTNGTGPAVRAAQSGTGYGTYGEITNASNTLPAVFGTTNGTGPAVEGVQTGTSGSAVTGSVSSSSNGSPAIAGTGSSIGRGGQFAGGAAQLRLLSGSTATHPHSGAAGDIYVDSSVMPWFCRGGTSWVPLITVGPQGPPVTRVIPSSSRRPPRAGKVGELFVDSLHRLWFCKKGGPKAKWKGIA
jgi:hypothetical protein